MNRIKTAETAERSSESAPPFLTPFGAYWPPSAMGILAERDTSRKASAPFDRPKGKTSIHLVLRREHSQSSTAYVAAHFKFSERSAEDWLGKREANEATPFSSSERSVSTVLAAYEERLPARIVDRIRELDEMPYDVEFGEDPMNPDSVECFIRCFLSMPRTEKLPGLSASSSGTLYAAWRPELGTKVSARFFPNGTIWVALLRSESEPETWEVSAEDVLREKSLLPIPGII